MINFNFKHKIQPKSKAGMDIGSHSVKLVEMLFPASGKPILTGFGVREFSGSGGAAISESIRGLASSIRTTVKEFAISVSGPSVIVRFISMPRMRREELAGAIRFEAEKHIPFNINECVLDFQIMREDAKENKIDVLLAAAKKEHIEERIKFVQAAGFSVSLVDIDGFAVSNAFLANYPVTNPDKTVFLLDIGAGLTNLSILRGSTICLLRDVAIGGKDFTAALAKTLAVDAATAEKSKLSPQDKAQAVLQGSKAMLNNLLDEVRLSCSYYENQCGRTIDDIFISGGGAGLIGLPEFFKESLGIKPNFLQPFQAIDTVNIDAAELKKTEALLAVAAGLAMR